MLPAENLPSAPSSAPLKLLEGVRVLDLTTSIAGPYASLLLADLGSEVFKIERPGRGDDARAWGPPFLDGESLWFLSVNRNKHSVTLDYAQEAGLEALHALVKVADVILINQVAKSQKKLGIDYERLKTINPRLIHVSITGFGLVGEKSSQPCYDLIAEGYSGVMDLTGPSLESAPQKVGTPAADLLSGSDAAMAVMAALIDRGRTGKGHEIDISMVESMTRFMTPRIIPYLGSNELPRRSGGTDSVIAIYQTFDTKDHPITLGLGNDAIWKRFCESIGRADMAADERFSDNAKRRVARAEIVGEIQSALLEKPRKYWLDLFSQARIPSGPINRLDQVATDPTLKERGLFYSVYRNDTAIPQVGLGIRFNGNYNTFRKEPPRLGEDNSYAFRSWLGWSDKDVHKLAEAGLL